MKRYLFLWNVIIEKIDLLSIGGEIGMLKVNRDYIYVFCIY